MTKSNATPTTYDNLCDAYKALCDAVVERLELVETKTVREDNSFDYEYWGCRGRHSDVSFGVDILRGDDGFSITQIYREPLDEDELDASKWDAICDETNHDAAIPYAKVTNLEQVENADGTFTVTYTFEIEVEVDDHKLEREYEEDRFDPDCYSRYDD